MTTYVYRFAWALLLLLGWLAYSPGLSGGFLFDDFVNLSALGATGAIDDWSTFWRYITSGTADPTGRPIALLSFLIDARDWPADPAPFLRTNVLLHLLNCSLLYLLLRKLGQVLGDKMADASAILGAGLWLLHPLFVSTTLYIVQREAMLPATFILAGLIIYCRGRELFHLGQTNRGLVVMVIGLMAGTLLAVLSKANGILLPLLVWVLEATAFRNAWTAAGAKATELSLKRFKAVFLIAPTVVVLGYVSTHLLDWANLAGTRGWTIGQRALTEPRVLLDYLSLLVVPRSISTGLFNDDYQLSTGLLQPLSTAPALLLVFGLAAAALWLRKRAPALSAALLFYFAAHLLESTVIPLELYFEHRNYVPALLFFWPLARAIVHLDRKPAIRFGIAVALLALFASTTYQRSLIWGQPAKLSALWASQNSDSSRAQASAAIQELSGGDPSLAKVRLEPLWQARPNDLQIALNYINAACSSGGLSSTDIKRLADTLRRADIGTLLVRQWLENALYSAVNKACNGLTMETLDLWLAAAQENPAINTPLAREKSMPPLLALVALEKNQPDQALAYFDRALIANLSPETAAGQASALATYGHFGLALEHLDTFDRLQTRAPPPQAGMACLHQAVLKHQGYWPNELAILRSKLKAEIAASGSGP